MTTMLVILICALIFILGELLGFEIGNRKSRTEGFLAGSKSGKKELFLAAHHNHLEFWKNFYEKYQEVQPPPKVTASIEELSEAYEQGYNAYDSDEDNPYSEDDPRHSEWERGYNEAEEWNEADE